MNGCSAQRCGNEVHGDPTHSAVQILNERFAKGEIQKEKYNERKAAILSGRKSGHVFHGTETSERNHKKPN